MIKSGYMNRIEIGYSSDEGVLHDLQLDLIFRTQVEISGASSPEMIEENNRLRADFINAADKSGYSEGLGFCSFLRMGITDRVTTEDLNRLACGRRDLNIDHFFVDAAKYFLERRNTGGYSEGM